MLYLVARQFFDEGYRYQMYESLEITDTAYANELLSWGAIIPSNTFKGSRLPESRTVQDPTKIEKA